MNAYQRKDLERAIHILKEASKQAAELIATVREENEESYENLPESLQVSDNGEEMKQAAETLADVELTLREAIEFAIKNVEELDLE